VGVDDGEGNRLLLKVVQAEQGDGVFEDIGMVAGMKGVSISEHPSTLAAF
jgi:hypothetical protein